MRVLGIDPGSRITGFGVIQVLRNGQLSYIASGCVRTPRGDFAGRLKSVYDGVSEVIRTYQPAVLAIEKVFMAANPDSALKLGQARGVVLLVPARLGLAVAEYPPNLVKKSVVGAGHAAKQQVQMMVRTLLPGAALECADAADALAVAICHAHHRGTKTAIERALKAEAGV